MGYTRSISGFFQRSCSFYYRMVVISEPLGQPVTPLPGAGQRAAGSKLQHTPEP